MRTFFDVIVGLVLAFVGMFVTGTLGLMIVSLLEPSRDVSDGISLFIASVLGAVFVIWLVRVFLRWRRDATAARIVYGIVSVLFLIATVGDFLTHLRGEPVVSAWRVAGDCTILVAWLAACALSFRPAAPVLPVSP